jgi:hypothetical protein
VGDHWADGDLVHYKQACTVMRTLSPGGVLRVRVAFGTPWVLVLVDRVEEMTVRPLDDRGEALSAWTVRGLWSSGRPFLDVVRWFNFKDGTVEVL